MASVYQHEITVQGTGPFPLDMLRYDACWPRTQSAVDAIHASIQGPRITEKEYTVELACVSNTKLSCWATERWASFGWAVIAQRTDRVGG
jgi:hypothetical protein